MRTHPDPWGTPDSGAHERDPPARKVYLHDDHDDPTPVESSVCLQVCGGGGASDGE